MWEARRRELENGVKVSVFSGGWAVPFADALGAMRGDEGFRAFLLAELRGGPFPAFFWETPPVTAETAARPFEYVAIAAPGLDGVTADARPFANRFARSGRAETVIAFKNLGGDGVLIAPRRLGPPRAYGHLGAFVRSAPIAQQHDLMALVGAEALRSLTDRPLWISTSGLGVYWVHVRLDSRPKYYTHASYRRWPPAS